MPAEFACQVDTDGTPGVGGVDFTSLAAAWATLRGSGGAGTLNLDSVDPWVIPGTLSGAIAPDTPVKQAATGIAGILVYRTASQALIKSATTTPITAFDDTHPWYPTADGSPGANLWTPSGPRDMAVIRLNCRGTAADTTPLAASGIGQVATGNEISYVTRVLIVGDFDPTQGGWDASKYRLQASIAGGGVVNFSTTGLCLELRNLQVWNTSADTSSDLTSALRSQVCALYVDRCLFRGARNTVYTSSTASKHIFRNSSGFGASKAAVYNAANSPVVAQNCTLVGGTHGLLTDSTAFSLAENTYASGSTAGFSNNCYVNNCASSDGTSAAGTNLIVSGTPLTSVPADATTFRAPASGDFRPASGSRLAYAGADLSIGRTRNYPNTAGGAFYTPAQHVVGLMQFTNGSSTAVYRQIEAGSNQYYDGVQRSPNVGLTIALPHASTTDDWVVLISDVHCLPSAGNAAVGYAVKHVNFPFIDALNAGTAGGGICAGKLKWMVVNGDLVDQGPVANYGPAMDTYRDIFTSGTGIGLASIPAAAVYHCTGNHDVPNAANGGSGGFESFRINRTDTTATLYTNPGGPESDENHIAFDVGNNRFVLVPAATDNAARVFDIDNPWLRTACSDAVNAGKNLFVINHAPRFGTTRASGSHWGHTAQTVCLLHMLPWPVWHSGHTHFAQYTNVGQDAACTLAEQDFPRARSAWDVGAGESPGQPRRPARNLRALGSAVAIRT